MSPNNFLTCANNNQIEMLARIKHAISKFSYSCLYNSGVLAHKTKVNWKEVRSVSLSKDEIHPVFVGSSSLYYVETPSLKGYFRPILPHVSYSQCVKDAVKEFFTEVHPEQELEYEMVKQTLGDKQSFRKFMDMGSFNDRYSRARKFYLTKDTTVVGIETPAALVVGTEEWKQYILNIHALLKYVKNSMSRHYRNRGGGHFEFSSVNRVMGTEAVAKLLDIEHLFPHTEFIEFNVQGYQMRGTLMAVAEGEKTNRIKKERSYSIASPALQRELTSLNILDAITFERDHRPGNYNIELGKDGKVAGISVFDNDAIMTFAPFPISSHSGSGSSCVVKNGFINRPHLDEDLANRIKSLKKAELTLALKPYLNRIQLAICWRRIVSLKKAIGNSMKNNKHFLLKREEWSEETMKEEISGHWGRTYLVTFLDYEDISKNFLEFAHVADL